MQVVCGIASHDTQEGASAGENRRSRRDFSAETDASQRRGGTATEHGKTVSEERGGGVGFSRTREMDRNDRRRLADKISNN